MDFLLLLALLSPHSIHLHTLLHVVAGQGRGRKKGLRRDVQSRGKCYFFISVTGAGETLSVPWVIWVFLVGLKINVV